MTIERRRAPRWTLRRVAAAVGALLIAFWMLPASEPMIDPARGVDDPTSSHGSPLVDFSGCTVIYASDASGAFAGNNEDGLNPLSRIWFVPGEEGALGSAFVGYDDMVIQGGMNEAGLFFDALGVREVQVPVRPGRPVYNGPGQNFVVDVMSACDSVSCVIDRFEAVSLAGTWNGQFLFGDRFGSSAIIEPLTIIPTEGRFQVAANFFQSEVPPAERTDDRYVTATEMLSEMDGFSPEVMRDVLAGTRQQGTVATVYSTVYELGSGVIHLYYLGDFDSEVTFDLGAELDEGVHGYQIADLFTSNQAAIDRTTPVRNRLAAVMSRLPATAVDAASLAQLAGTYEAPPYLTLIVEATDDGLLMRLPWTSFVPVTALSSSEFAFVYSDPDGMVHEQWLRFRPAGMGGPAELRISEEGMDAIVAVRTANGGAAASWPAMGIVLALLLAVGGIAWWTTAHWRLASGASAPVHRPALPEPHDAHLT